MRMALIGKWIGPNDITATDLNDSDR